MDGGAMPDDTYLRELVANIYRRASAIRDLHEELQAAGGGIARHPSTVEREIAAELAAMLAVASEVCGVIERAERGLA
jgi:hypothetical protein